MKMWGKKCAGGGGGGGHKHTIAPQAKKWGSTCPPSPPPLPTPVYIQWRSNVPKSWGGTQTRDLCTFGKEPI